MRTKISPDSILRENQRLKESLKRSLFELSVLYDISNSISSTVDLHQLLDIIMDSLHKVVNYDVCASLFLAEGDIPKGIIRTSRPINRRLLCDIQEDIITSFSALTGKIISREDVNIKLSLSQKKSATQSGVSKLRSSFDVPLLVRNKILGIIRISSSQELNYTDEDIKLLYTLANQASSAVERVRAVIAAEKSKLKTVVESMSEGVVMTDDKGELVVFNPAAKEMLGLQKDEIFDRQRLVSYFKDKGLEYFSNNKKFKGKILKTDIHVEYPFPRILQCEQLIIQDSAKNESGRLMVLRDVTKEREIEKMKSDFVSTVSHELRTPLAAIRGSTENILDGITGGINEIQRECLEIIKRNIDRLSRLINDLLDISRIESGRLELHRKHHVDMKLLVDDVIKLLGASAQTKGILLTTVIDRDVQTQVYADPDKITQVLTNLVSNAIKFTPSGGRIIIQVKKNNNLLQVDVIDTGKGIPPSELNRIFDKFYQIRQATDAQGVKGTGLGLPISNGIIQKHGGKMWVESQLGKGSKFSFTLPYNEKEDLIKAKEKNG
jgi:PAS domain S-box-containing protein